MKFISVVTPCYNEEGNVEQLYREIKAVFDDLPQYDYEHVYIDNASTDGTVAILREIAKRDPRVKIIVNNRNFGHVRSPYHGLLQAKGDAVIGMCSDLQDPPQLIVQFLEGWEEGYPIVLGQKTTSEEAPLFFFIRRCYYRLAKKLADVELIENVTGFGLYDRKVIEAFRGLDDSYPYVRGLISEMGYSVKRVAYMQATRKRGVTKNNFYTLFDVAMLGITSHSKVPLRLATMLGFAMSFISFLIAMGYLVAKLLFWNHFEFGLAPLIIGLFFFASLQLFCIGLVGEYIGFIHTQVLNRPLVVERERINFTDEARPAASGDELPAIIESTRE